jgi:putrescine aminotransferase
MADGLLAAGDFNHGLTYSGHPVAAAVAVANIKLLREGGIIEQVKTDTGPYFQKSLREALANSPLVGEIHGAGLVAGIQLTKDKATRTRFDDPWGLGNHCRDHCFRNNLIMRATADRMLLSPPLVITRAEVDELVEKASRCIGLTAKDLGMI